MTATMDVFRQAKMNKDNHASVVPVSLPEAQFILSLMSIRMRHTTVPRFPILKGTLSRLNPNLNSSKSGPMKSVLERC
jgi:hypothetical protein